MASVFEKRASQQPKIVDQTKETKDIGGSPFQRRAKSRVEEESFGKSSLRTALQVPQGFAEATPYGIATGLWSVLGAGEVNDPEEIDRIRAISEREGVPFNEESYKEAGQNALNYLPTVSNIGREVENATGLPLEAKTRLQKGVRFATSASKLAPKDYTFRGMNTSLPKPVLGVGIEAAREGLIESGVPEPFADLASFAVVKKPSEGAGKINIGASTKPSGLTERNYEKLKKPREVAPSTIQKINEKTEAEFKGIAEKILQDAPISKTHNALKDDFTFKQKSAEAFQDVSNLANSLPETFQGKDFKESISNLISNKKNKGTTPSEFDKKHNDFIQEFIKDTPDSEFKTADLVEQYRKNNKGLSDAYEPGQSFAYNSAKREALLDINRTISDVFEKKFPNSEFSKIFKETNKQWADISDAESIHIFLDKLFEGKIQFKKGREFFDKQGMTVPFKRAMGPEGFNKFETLMKDLMGTEQASKLLKEAKVKGFNDLAKTAGSYLLDPSLAKAKLGYDAIKGGYNKIFELLLDKPQLSVSWDRGINAMKAGNFKAAEKEFSKVEAANKDFDIREKSRVEALKKVKDRSNKTESTKGNSENINDAFSQMGKGLVDNFYEGIFDSLKKGKDTFSGVKDPLLIAAKPAFEAGQIKNIDDLKKFSKFHFEQQSKVKNTQSIKK